MEEQHEGQSDSNEARDRVATDYGIGAFWWHGIIQWFGSLIVTLQEQCIHQCYEREVDRL